MKWPWKRNKESATWMSKSNIDLQVCHDEHRPITFIYIFWKRDHAHPIFTLQLNDEDRKWLIDQLSEYDSVRYKKFREWKNSD